MTQRPVHVPVGQGRLPPADQRAAVHVGIVGRLTEPKRLTQQVYGVRRAPLEAAYVAEFYQRSFGKELPESAVNVALS